MPDLAPCTVFNKDGCFTSTNPNEDTSGLPFVASLWFGLRALIEAAVPITLFFAWKYAELKTIARNDAYKYTWYVMWIGSLAVYGPIALFWPFTYNSNGGVGKVYLFLWKWGHFLIGTIYHITVLIMFWWARRTYLFETTLSFEKLTYEMLAYYATIILLFRMSTIELRMPFTQYYIEHKISSFRI